MNERHPLAVSSLSWAILLLLGGFAEAGQPHFYLSSERAFSPSEKSIYVRLEARDIDSLQVRLYRIGDPVKFFRKQADPHRVVLPGEPVRSESLELLGELGRSLLAVVRDQARDTLSARSRDWLGRSWRRQLDAVNNTITRPVARSQVFPPLKNFELVDSWRELLPRRGRGWNYLKLEVPVKRSGVYLVEALGAGEVGRTILLVSRLALLTRQSQDQLLVFAADPDLGTPQSGARILVLDQDHLLGKGESDDTGRWTLQLPLVHRLVVMASRGDDFALLDPSYYPATVFGRKVYLTTERPVYKPGQQVLFKGIVRSWSDEGYAVAKAGPVTVWVEDPRGNRLPEQQLEMNERGSFDGRLPLPDSAASGTYRLLARVAGKVYGGEFKVKAYVKPDYRVQVLTERKVYTAGEKVEAKVKASYYFGPPVTEGQVKVVVYRTRFEIPWWVDAEYSWYYSDAEYRSSLRETILEKTGSLSADGTFAVEFATKPEGYDFSYGIEAVVIDPANRSVSGRRTIRVTRAPFRVAIEPRQLLFSPGQSARVPIRASDFEGRPVDTELEIEVTALAGSEPAQAQKSQIASQKLKTGAQGRAEFEFKPERGGVYTIRAVARLDQGRRLEETARLFVTESGGDIPYAPEQLEIIADRKSYRVGDWARFLILVPHADAHLLVTVEGGRLYDSQVLQARGYSRVVETKISAGQAPNFVVRVATLFGQQLYQRFLDVVVPPRRQLLKVAVRAEPPEARPGQKVQFEVAVTDHLGKPVNGAEVALAVVDDAIYAISPEIAVPIEQFFYHRKRNNVRAGCSLDFRFYGYGEKPQERTAALTQRPAVVPGAFKAAIAGKVRKKFRDTLAWFPALVTDSQGRARVTVTMADNLTTWRATARAITGDTRVGQGTGSMKVTKPVVVRLAAPEYLVEGDSNTMAVLVHNYTKKTRQFEIGLEQKGQRLQLGATTRRLSVAPGQLGLLTWPVQAARPGAEKLRAFAQAGEYTDALEQPLEIVPYGMRQTLVAGGYLDNNHDSAEFHLQVPETARADSIKARVTVSAGVVPALLAAVDYLVGYPYGCTEQTMSRFLPDLIVAKALEQLQLKHQRLAEQLPRYVNAGLARLAQLQHGDGGWGWWTDDATDPFMTAYVVYGLSLARKHGWDVDEQMLERGVRRLRQLLRRAPDDNLRAYMLYSLALAGAGQQDMLPRLVRSGKLNDYSRALLASTWFELGQKQQALQVTGQLVRAVHTSDGTAWWGELQSVGWRSDAVESTAAVLRALVAVEPDNQYVARAVRWLLSQRQGRAWHSTRDTAMAVYALVDVLLRGGAGDYDAELRLGFNDRELPAQHFGAEQVLQESMAVGGELSGRPGANTFRLQRSGQGDLFYTATIDYFGREKQFTARGEQLRVERRLQLLKRRQEPGGRWSFKLEPLPSRLRPGDEILVVLQLQARRDFEYVMVADSLPAGVRPVESDAGYRVPGVRLRQRGLHREFRQRQALFFIDRLPRGTRRLAYLLRAELPGDYAMLPARAELMYDPQVAGTSSSQRLAIGE